MAIGAVSGAVTYSAGGSAGRTSFYTITSDGSDNLEGLSFEATNSYTSETGPVGTDYPWVKHGFIVEPHRWVGLSANASGERIKGRLRTKHAFGLALHFWHAPFDEAYAQAYAQTNTQHTNTCTHQPTRRETTLRSTSTLSQSSLARLR